MLKCAYCAEPADTMDHVMLRAFVLEHVGMGDLARQRIAACEQVALLEPTIAEVWLAQEEG